MLTFFIKKKLVCYGRIGAETGAAGSRAASKFLPGARDA
jgi:hypothetical protein